MLLEIIIGVLISYSLLFILSIVLEDNSIVDIFWGIGFLQITIHSLYLSGTLKISQILLLIIISAWSIRLFSHILNKRIERGSEDPRYAKWRKEWNNFYLRSILQIYFLQGILLILVSSSIILLNYNPINIGYTIITGLLISVFGLVFETVADHQLKKFISNKENEDEIMKEGLWKYSRHPNYFGESVFWLGITIISIQSSIFSIISFVTITVLLRFVSGVPIAENRMKEKEGFEEYAENTPVFIPNFFKN